MTKGFVVERTDPERLRVAFEQYRHAIWHDICRKFHFTCRECSYDPAVE